MLGWQLLFNANATLGRGEPLQVPVLRIVIVFAIVFLVLLGILLALKSGKFRSTSGFAALLKSSEQTFEVKLLHRQRINPQTELVLIEDRDHHHLVLLSPNAHTVLSTRSSVSYSQNVTNEESAK